MKKFLLSILVLLAGLLLVVNTQTTYALTDDDVLLIYVEAPEGWDTPHLWTWNDDGDSAFAILGWPGKAMIADANNDGWFYLYVPNNMESAIINNGLTDENAKQTEAFDLETEDMWTTIALVSDKFEATTSTVKATSGNLPVFVDTIYVFALVPIDWDFAGIWAWTHPAGTNVIEGSSWPGTKMTLKDDGWFMIEIPAAANRVIINDFAASNTKQTIDIDLLTGNNYIVVGDLVDNAYEAETFTEKPIIIEDGLTVYVTVPTNWSSPHAWAWSHPDGTNLYPAWPGEELTYDEENSVWVLVVPNWVNRIIINNSIDGTVVQTVDIDLPEGEEFDLTVTEADGTGKYGFEISARSDVEPENPDPTPDPTPDPDPTPSEDNPKSPWLWIGIGAGVLLMGAGVTFLILRKRS